MTHDPHTTPDPKADFWADVQADYLAGITASVLAERYGVSVSTIRRRAAAEGWRRADRTSPESSSWKSPMFDRGAALERYPELLELEEEHAGDVIDLLFYPTTQILRCFAFRRAAEVAAKDRPTEACAWMRLVALLKGSGAQIDTEMRPFLSAQYLRAAHLAGLKLHDPDSDQSERSGK